MHNNEKHPHKHTSKKQSNRGKVIGVPDDLIWGINPVIDYINDRPNQIKEISILKSKKNPRIQQLIDLARNHHIKINFVDEFPGSGYGPKMTHQGVTARITPVPTISLDDLLDRLRESSSPPLLLALDSIQDPHNLGAIIRSAGAAGVDGIILPRDRTAPLSGTTAKVAAGAMSHVQICLVTNLARALARMKEQSIWICGTDLQTDTVMYDQDLSLPLCLVIGSEGKGLRQLIKNSCDFLVKIPMHSGTDSLNASVASGIILFEAVRQRRL